MLDKDSDIGQLESAIEKSGIQRVSQRQLCLCHIGCGVPDSRKAGNNIGDVYDQQSGDDADRQHRSHFAHQIRTEDRHHEDKDPNQKSAQKIRQSRQSAQRSSSCGKGHRRRHTHDTDIEHFKKIGKDRCKSSVKRIIIGTVIIYLMLSGKTQTVGKKYRIVDHSQNRHDQTPDPETHKITVDLGAGSESAAKMRSKPYERYSQDHCCLITSFFHLLSPSL